MITLKEHINNEFLKTDRKINDDIFVKSGVLFIDNGKDKYKFENDCYYILAGDKYINMQGGIPNYSVENFSNADENIFEIERETVD